MNKDDFQFIQWFILWLKRIFHNPEPPIKGPQPSEEASVKVEPTIEKLREVSLAEEKLVEVPLEEKLLEVTPLPEEGLPEIPSEEEPVVADLLKEKQPEVSSVTFEEGTFTKVFPEPSGEEVSKVEPLKESEECPKHPKTMEEIETEPQINYYIEEVKTEDQIIHKEENDTPKPQKPYIKKPPPEKGKREPIEQPRIERKPSSTELKKTIDLGDIPKKWRTRVPRKSQNDENIGWEKADKTQEERELAISIESPFVEINLDEAKIYLILPKQQFKANTVDKTSQQLSYRLELNGEQQEVHVKTTTEGDGCVVVEEKRIPLEEPLETFKVAFPDELQGREYNYNHNGKELYVFVAIGNNRGRMYPLYDKDGNINLLPKRYIWMLLDEDFESQTEPDITEERWIWKKYQPSRIDLSEIDSVVIKHKISGEKKSFGLQSTFHLEGGQLIEDDFRKECPLFTGKTLKIVAPDENQSGWNLWIQNKVAGYKVKENWTGKAPLVLKLPEDLPCDCGEFQLDVCKQSTRIADETLFFRFIPYIEFHYPKELLIPDTKKGHSSSMISIKLDGDGEWKLKSEGSQLVKSIESSSYQLELSSEKDTARFSISKQGRLETILNFKITISRLKWRTSKQKTWSDKIHEIKREELIAGEDFYLFVRINDFDNQYDLLSILETNNQKLQPTGFVRKGMDYQLLLNQFRDTIGNNKSEITLGVEIRKTKDTQLLGKVNILHFPAEVEVIKKKEKQPPAVTTTLKSVPKQKIQGTIQAVVIASKMKKRKGKGFSTQELIKAGINIRDVHHMNIPYDKRRKSAHQRNIKSLQLLMGDDTHAN